MSDFQFGPPKEIIKNVYEISPDALEQLALWLEARGLQSPAMNLIGSWGIYNAYTPTWTSSGTQPSFGNASVTARFTHAGKIVHANGQITFGSTTTFGTGTYSFALPVLGFANIENLGLGVMFDSSSNAFGLAEVAAASTMTMSMSYGATYLGTGTAVAATTPWTWAQNDRLVWNIIYEAA